MPSPTAVRVCDAALEVLGTGGIHALSHARVDATAGLPPGSSSNYFRTRAALVAGAVERLRQLDAEAWQALADADPPSTLPGLIAAFTAFVEDATGRSRTRTTARYVIFVQGVVEPHLLDRLNADRRLITAWTAGILTTLAVPDPEATAHTLLAAVEGLIMHRLTGFATDPPGPRLDRLITGLCGRAAP
ncbi:TetR/AcrR family transcriptional regulator [Actinoplanes flavus]|uniref:TetR family transcriptional regulator n=1 Tax=Actinoplanes flavus TaxID=2820290 RepID=A0ABS3UVF0_9ACTN|nr:TetR family transcriptional regulator [Actinoplanes flavus]MBO3742569.1 TetR family transcriptional regulator [Actinoplanes flavus]